MKDKKKKGKKEIEIIGENNSADDNIPVTRLGKWGYILFFFPFLWPCS